MGYKKGDLGESRESRSVSKQKAELLEQLCQLHKGGYNFMQLYFIEYDQRGLLSSGVYLSVRHEGEIHSCGDGIDEGSRAEFEHFCQKLRDSKGNSYGSLCTTTTRTGRGRFCLRVKVELPGDIKSKVRLGVFRKCSKVPRGNAKYTIKSTEKLAERKYVICADEIESPKSCCGKDMCLVSRTQVKVKGEYILVTPQGNQPDRCKVNSTSGVAKCIVGLTCPAK
ncbi:hypothetical protein NDN08_002051 [Rhodosorus marinus]|uniref:Uncharacterized protein n=1 Tax=Rhodosorus marinus TaxID=101924 RepID=A0AAV8UU32_9RHOD|nr:hypothetical protein NDN08_002051 [Rhodosorus marinus]